MIGDAHRSPVTDRRRVELRAALVRALREVIYAEHAYRAYRARRRTASLLVTLCVGAVVTATALAVTSSFVPGEWGGAITALYVTGGVGLVPSSILALAWREAYEHRLKTADGTYRYSDPFSQFEVARHEYDAAFAAYVETEPTDVGPFIREVA